MAQNNLYMEDDELELYVDVQPQYIDALENSKNAAAQSALSAQQSASSASESLNNIVSYKTNLELFYAQAANNLSSLLSGSITNLTNAKNAALESIQSLKTAVLNNINTTLQNALSSINTIGQNIINQAKGYAQDAQNTVDNRVSSDYLIQSNALESGSVSSVSNVLENIKSYAHSTFDASKFTVVGSPIVTSDGIASNCYDYNCIKIPFDSTSTNFKVSIKNIIPSASGQTMYGVFGLLMNDYGISIPGSQSTGLPYIMTFVRQGATQYNKSYDFYLEKVGTTYTAGIKLSTETTYSTKTETYTTSLIGSYLQLGYSLNAPASFDLKNIEITVDGVEVFSGNRTGIDTVKADDYTSNGSSISSLITNDGILGYNLADSNTNYIESPSITLGNNFDIYVRYKLISVPAGFRIFGENSGTSILRGYIGNYSLALNFTASDDSTISMPNISITEAQVGQWCTLKFSFDGTKYVATIYNENGASTGTATLTSSLLPKYTKFNTQGGSTSASANYQIDLNELKIYVNGDLAWQPCLKIPYTESKTGSKIVDAIYRDRVADMSAQFGYAPYYTLSDNDFTLPKGEIYGMMENLRKLIIDRTSQAEE